MSIFLLSLLSALITVAVKCYASIAVLKAVALFFGLEGTVLLASAISPPHGDMEEMPKGLINKFLWPFSDGRRLNYPFNYNYVYYYGGLLFLATSFVLSAI